MRSQKVIAIATTVATFAFAGFASALSVTCTGVPTSSQITWSAASTGGVLPVSYLWGNGATTTSHTVAASAGLYTTTIQATDASSTVATSTCSATVPQGAPTIGSFTATPTTITAGQSSILSWVVSNASSTSVSGNGTVSGNSLTVSPLTTTTYTLSATNGVGTTTAAATVVVNATTTPGTGPLSQIQILLNQIAALKAQILLILSGQPGTGSGGGSGTGTTTPMGCYEFWRDLKRGDHGDDVRELQQRLAHENPTMFPPGLVNGVFGPKTEAALKMLQRQFGISAFDGSFTGFFGKKSRDYMKSQCSGGDADKDGIRNSEDPDDDNDGILDLQDSKPFSNASTTEAKKEKKDDNDRQNRGRGNDGRDDD